MELQLTVSARSAFDLARKKKKVGNSQSKNHKSRRDAPKGRSSGGKVRKHRRRRVDGPLERRGRKKRPGVITATRAAVILRS